MKKTIKLMVQMLTLVVLLAACGGATQKDADSEYPALELPDVTGLTTAEATGNGAKYSYPVDKWTFDEASGQLFYNDTLEASAKVNGTVRFEAAGKKLTDSDLEDIRESLLDDSMSFIEAKHSEFVSVGDSKVVYLDLCITNLDDYVDMIIEQAGLSEQDLEAYGGRDGLLEMIPPTNQLMFYFNVDGDLYSLSGVYFDDTHKDALLELFATVLPTVVKD